MRRGGGKQKGNRHEWKIAKELSIWYYGEPNALVRNSNSGAVATVRLDRTMPAGDLQQVKYFERPFPYSVECKHLKDVDLMDLLTNRKSGNLTRAWKQTLHEKQDGKIPLLVFTANHKPTFCVSDQVPVGIEQILGLGLYSGRDGSFTQGASYCFVFLLQDFLKKV
jgi:hypothetical protein